MAKVSLLGAYDMHVHSFPDLMPRVGDDIELATRARSVGMAGLLLKSHYAPTAERAWLVRKVVPEVQTMGAIVLNHFVGGINPLAVEALARAGGRVVFMPTSDAANESSVLHTWDSSKPLPPYLQIKKELADQDRLPRAISLLKTSGAELTSEVMTVLEVIRDYDIALATGHIGWQEIRVLIPAAHRLGIRRLVVTHPESPSINLSLDQQAELMPFGVYFERCLAYLFAPEKMAAAFDAVRRTGTAHNILSSDLGAPGWPHPDEGLRQFVAAALAAELPEDDVRLMITTNPAAVLLA